MREGDYSIRARVDNPKEALGEVRAELLLRNTQSIMLLFSMGSQFDHLILQAVARRGVFCLVADPSTVTADDVRKLKPAGIIISGGPASVHAEPPPFGADRPGRAAEPLADRSCLVMQDVEGNEFDLD